MKREEPEEVCKPIAAQPTPQVFHSYAYPPNKVVHQNYFIPLVPMNISRSDLIASLTSSYGVLKNLELFFKPYKGSYQQEAVFSFKAMLDDELGGFGKVSCKEHTLSFAPTSR